MPSRMVSDFNQLGSEIVLENLYGPTEATIYSSAYSTANYEGGVSVPIGEPLTNVGMLILDPYQRLCGRGVLGELCISGVGLARGYLGDSDLTAAKFMPHPYRSGDRLYRTGDLVRYLGLWSIQIRVNTMLIMMLDIYTQIVNIGL